MAAGGSQLKTWRLTFDDGSHIWIAAVSHKAAIRRYKQLLETWSVFDTTSITEYQHAKYKPVLLDVRSIKDAGMYSHRKVY